MSMRLVVLLGVFLLVLALAWVIFMDGPGGPVIVIDPGEGGIPGAESGGRPVKWTVTCRNEEAVPYGSAGSPPSIPSRFVHTKGVEKIEFDPPMPDTIFPLTIQMFVVAKGVTHEVAMEMERPNAQLRWLLDKRIVVGNGNRDVHWPEEMLGAVTKILVNGNEREVKRIRIHYNKAWGRPGCN